MFTLRFLCPHLHSGLESQVRRDGGLGSCLLNSAPLVALMYDGLGNNGSGPSTHVTDEETKHQRGEMTGPSAHRPKIQTLTSSLVVLYKRLSDFGAC